MEGTSTVEKYLCSSLFGILEHRSSRFEDIDRLEIIEKRDLFGKIFE